MKEVVIIDGFRTPYAKAGTVFKDVHPVELGARIVRETLARTGVDPAMVDEVIVGNAGMPADSANIARVIALRAGLPEGTPAYSVQRNCASGMQAVASAYTQILAGMSDIVLAGGVESMSSYDYYMTRKLRDVITTVQRGRTRRRSRQGHPLAQAEGLRSRRRARLGADRSHLGAYHGRDRGSAGPRLRDHPP